MALSKEDRELLENKEKMKTVTFLVRLNGTGKTVDEAWDDMIDSFFQDPGCPLDDEIESVEEEEE